MQMHARWQAAANPCAQWPPQELGLTPCRAAVLLSCAQLPWEYVAIFDADFEVRGAGDQTASRKLACKLGWLRSLHQLCVLA